MSTVTPVSNHASPPRPKRAASPRVRNVVHVLADKIRNRELRPGDRLVPIRQLAAQHAISFRTALSVVSELENMGLVERRQGSGTYVRRKPPTIDPAMAPRKATAVYLLMTHRPEAFRMLIQPMVTLLQEHGLMPIPVDVPADHPTEAEDQAVMKLLRGYWEHQPPRAVIVKGAFIRLMKLIRKQAPRSTRLIRCYGGTTNLPDGFHLVAGHERAGYRLAADYLLDRGHRRLGMVTMPRRRLPGDKSSGVVRQTHILTLIECLRERGLNRSNLRIHFNRPGEADRDAAGNDPANIERLIRWLTGPEAPTGIIALTYRLDAVKIAASHAGLRIGKDLELVGMGDTTPARLGHFACVDEQYQAIARQMLKLVLADDLDEDDAVHQIIVPPRLIEPAQD